MKILFLTSSYPSRKDDPRGIFVHRLARGLVQAGAELVVVTPAQRGVARGFELEEVRVCQAPYWLSRWQTLAEGIEGIGPRIRARPWRAFLLPPMVFGMAVSGLRRAGGCDVVHAHWLYPAGVVGVAVARRAGAPLVVTARGADVNLARGNRILGRVSRWVLENADAAVGVSAAISEGLLDFGAKAPRVHQIPSGLEIPPPDPAFYEEEGLDLEWFRSQPSPRLLFVGSLSRRKSVGTLIQAHRALEGRGLHPSTVIIGGGPERRVLERSARGTENVRLLGTIAPERIPPWLRASDFLILPSISEGRPNVVAEAMAAGTVVVASDIPGTRELVAEGESGFLFPPGESAGLADAVQRALAISPAAREDLVRRAHARIDRLGLSIDAVVGRYLELYRSLTTGPEGPSVHN